MEIHRFRQIFMKRSTIDSAGYTQDVSVVSLKRRDNIDIELNFQIKIGTINIFTFTAMDI